MKIIGYKRGAGQFIVYQNVGKVYVDIRSHEPNGSRAMAFDSAEDAYSHCYERYDDLHGTMDGFSYLNACHDLEPLVAMERQAA